MPAQSHDNATRSTRAQMVRGRLAELYATLLEAGMLFSVLVPGSAASQVCAPIDVDTGGGRLSTNPGVNSPECNCRFTAPQQGRSPPRRGRGFMPPIARCARRVSRGEFMCLLPYEAVRRADRKRCEQQAFSAARDRSPERWIRARFVTARAFASCSHPARFYCFVNVGPPSSL
jgi:hypothetical protein